MFGVGSGIEKSGTGMCTVCVGEGFVFQAEYGRPEHGPDFWIGGEDEKQGLGGRITGRSLKMRGGGENRVWGAS